MTQLFNEQPGPLPLASVPYTSQGGSMMFLVSGTAWSTVNYISIGCNLVIDGKAVGVAKTSINEPYSHKSFSSTIVVNGLPAGTHAIQLTPLTTYGEQSDVNDFYTVTVVEVVPAE
jgi:hypothetical protein